jgi:hypothetical protein
VSSNTQKTWESGPENNSCKKLQSRGEDTKALKALSSSCLHISKLLPFGGPTKLSLSMGDEMG